LQDHRKRGRHRPALADRFADVIGNPAATGRLIAGIAVQEQRMSRLPKIDLSRNAIFAAVAGVTVAAAGLAALGLGRRRSPRREGHAAPDLPRDGTRPTPEARAPVDFRPDPTAPVSAEDREALRPATGPSPTLVADRGAVRSEP
jgi:hypothetical protein